MIIIVQFYGRIRIQNHFKNIKKQTSIFFNVFIYPNYTLLASVHSKRKDYNSLQVLRTGRNPPAHRISARGASKRPFSVSEKCGTERQTQVS